MDLAQIAVLLKPFVELTSPQLEQTSRYLDLLLKWNARINLTAVRRAEQLVPRHFGESYFAASQLLSGEEDCGVIDVGSGAGFPGLPLAIFRPEAHVSMIEADSRKAAFLNEVITILGLKNARALNQRAEAYSEVADLVTLRAVEKFERSLSTSVGFLRTGGRVALMVGSSQVESARLVAPEISWSDPVAIPESRSRVLFVGTNTVKVG